MQYKQFGKNGPMVSRLGFGCMRLPSIGEGAEKRCDDEKCIPIIHRAYELGINLIDAGHFHTENPTMPIVAEKLRKAFPGVEVVFSEKHRDVMRFY